MNGLPRWAEYVWWLVLRLACRLDWHNTSCRGRDDHVTRDGATFDDTRVHASFLHPECRCTWEPAHMANDLRMSRRARRCPLHGWG